MYKHDYTEVSGYDDPCTIDSSHYISSDNQLGRSHDIQTYQKSDTDGSGMYDNISERTYDIHDEPVDDRDYHVEHSFNIQQGIPHDEHQEDTQPTCEDEDGFSNRSDSGVYGRDKKQEGACKTTDSCIDWDSFMPWSSDTLLGSRRRRFKSNDLPEVTPTKWDKYIDDLASPFADEKWQAEESRPSRVKTAPLTRVRLRAGGSQSPVQSSTPAPSRNNGDHRPRNGEQMAENVQQAARNGPQSPDTGAEGSARRPQQRIQETPESHSTPRTHLTSHGGYAKAVRRELTRLMGPEEAPSGVPAPAPLSPAGASPPTPSTAASATWRADPSAAAAAAAESGSWPRAALSTRWLNDHLCKRSCSHPCPPRRTRQEYEEEASTLGAMELRRARAEAAARLREAVEAAERAARHQTAAGADSQLAEAAAAAAARDYRTFVVGHMSGELPSASTASFGSGGFKVLDSGRSGRTGAGDEPAVRIVGYVGVTRPVTPPPPASPPPHAPQPPRSSGR